jgi:hypothetical protein
MSDQRTILVWRYTGNSLSGIGGKICSYCGAPTESYVHEVTPDGISTENYESHENTWCLLCGWSSSISLIGNNLSSSCAHLRVFDLNSVELELAEVGTHLRHRFDDIYLLTPNRFEAVVGDIFRQSGFDPIFTKQTRDGGVDIFLASRKSGHVEAIVQCKRYHVERKVDIAAVQRLAGASLQWSAKKAYLATTSSVSRDGSAAKRAINREGTIELEFMEANDLLRLLQIYNVKMPPLEHLTEDVRRQIIEGNRRSGG